MLTHGFFPIEADETGIVTKWGHEERGEDVVIDLEDELDKKFLDACMANGFVPYLHHFVGELREFREFIYAAKELPEYFGKAV